LIVPSEFELTEHQRQVKRMVREFADAEIKPLVMEWEEAQHFPKDLMSALGLMGVVVQEEYGGLGVPVQA
jgi:alkylation response protein AidB-like acyl-CoA dehydrogenase